MDSDTDGRDPHPSGGGGVRYSLDRAPQVERKSGLEAGASERGSNVALAVRRRPGKFGVLIRPRTTQTSLSPADVPNWSTGDDEVKPECDAVLVDD